MGTSRGYRAPTSQGWPPLKRLVTQFGGGSGGEGPLPNPPLPPEAPEPSPVFPPDAQLGPTPEQLLAQYIAVNGGAVAMASAITGGGGAGATGGRGSGGGGGGGGRQGGGGVRRVGRAVARTGQNLGRFASRVREAGLADALREFDLGDLVGRPAGDVMAGLVDRLCGPGSTMDESLARSALNDLRQELIGDARTFEEVERALSSALERLEVTGLIVRFYGQYLYRMFVRDFSETLAQKVGRDRARRAGANVLRTIRSKLRAVVAGRDPAAINWHGAQGHQLAQRILTTTLQIFEAGA